MQKEKLKASKNQNQIKTNFTKDEEIKIFVSSSTINKKKEELNKKKTKNLSKSYKGINCEERKKIAKDPLSNKTKKNPKKIRSLNAKINYKS